MANTQNIISPNWTLSISEAYELVQGVDAVQQSIQIILETQKGSQPLMPDFGINLANFVGKPMTSAAAELISDIRFQIEKYEKRAKITSITQQAQANGQFTINLFWTYNGATGTNSITV
jgi:uncharacterized protein